jgi:hypothetical protein
LRFATVEQDGEMFMSPADFFRAIGIEKPDAAPALFKQYFKMAGLCSSWAANNFSFAFKFFRAKQFFSIA